MEVSISIQKALDAKQACQRLLQKSFPPKTVFKLVTLNDILSKVEQTFLETRRLTILKYGKKDDNGDIITEQLENGQSYIPIEPEYQQICTKEISEALIEEVEIPAIEININEFGDEILAGNDLLGLYPFLVE